MGTGPSACLRGLHPPLPAPAPCACPPARPHRHGSRVWRVRQPIGRPAGPRLPCRWGRVGKRRGRWRGAGREGPGRASGRRQPEGRRAFRPFAGAVGLGVPLSWGSAEIQDPRTKVPANLSNLPSQGEITPEMISSGLHKGAMRGVTGQLQVLLFEHLPRRRDARFDREPGKRHSERHQACRTDLQRQLHGGPRVHVLHLLRQVLGPDHPMLGAFGHPALNERAAEHRL